MSGTYLTGLAGWLRDAGLNVVEYDGWQTRARSSGGYASGRPWCFMWHHTASSTTPANDASYMCNGSSDRPIANLLVARDGTVWVLAAGATNTNGKGGPYPVSRGTVPADSMNTYAVGMEIANSGVGEPYPQPQIDAAFAASIAVCQALGLAATDICNHYTWAPTRKIDPATAAGVEGPWRPGSCTSSGTWDLADLVAEHVARFNGAAPAPEPEPEPEEDDDVAKPVMLVAANDGTALSTCFAYSGDGIWWIPNSEARDAGIWLGWWQYGDNGDYYRNFSQAQIQALINTCWRGGAVPKPYTPPT